MKKLPSLKAKDVVRILNLKKIITEDAGITIDDFLKIL